MYDGLSSVLPAAHVEELAASADDLQRASEDAGSAGGDVVWPAVLNAVCAQQRVHGGPKKVAELRALPRPAWRDEVAHRVAWVAHGQDGAV